MARAVKKTEPKISPGDRVMVTEEGLTPWEGEVGHVKWSSESGWWVEVRRDDVGTYVMHERSLTRIERKE
jgi:hypothetical protein